MKTESLLFFAVLFISVHVMLGSEQETACQNAREPIFQTTLYNHTMKWGTYRPQVIFGMKTRSPKSIMTGLMWHRADTIDGINKMRHNSNMDFQNVRYGWNRHDGQYFAMQQIRDFENQLLLDTNLLKHVEEKTFIPEEDDETKGEYRNNEKGGDWTVKIQGKDLQQLKQRPIISVCFYIALENDEKASLRISGVQGSKKQGLPSTTPIIIRGSNEDVREFSLLVSGKEGQKVDNYDNYYFYGVKKNPSDVWKIHDDVKNMLGHQLERTLQDLHENQKTISESDFPISVLPNTIEEDSNVLVIQKFLRSPFELDVAFLSHEQHPDIFSNYQIKEHGSKHMETFVNTIKEYRQCFENKFQERFNLKNRQLREGEKDMLMYALSNMVGGIGYYYGDSYHQYGGQQVRTIEPYSLFTACPCRSFFPRGFLWDEGFHSLLIQKWNKHIAKDIITNWFNVMDKKTGWIPREQILGEEARTRVPKEFQVQQDTHANPPMLFLAVLELLQHHLQHVNDEISIDIHGHSSPTAESTTEAESMVSFLKQVYPNMKKNYDWYLTTQAGSLKNSYRWRGRTPGHTLSSGLDDYPRGNTNPSVEERHLDLYCWVYMMTETMNKIHNMIYKKDSDDLVNRMKTMRQEIDTLHFNKDIDWFSDYAGKPVGNDTRPEFSPHIGYISLFPFLFDVPDFDNRPKLFKQILDYIIRDKLWTPHGLPSLSTSDSQYGTKENYWRGPIWININYLTLRALNKCKDKSPRCSEIYTALRTNIMETLYGEWRKSRTLYEQYSSISGKGQGAHPFTGWTALITLIAGEIY